MENKTFFKKVNPNIEKIMNPTAQPWEVFQGPLKNFFIEMNCGLKLLGKVSDQAYIEGDNIFIHPEACVEAGAYIKGPCYIGAGTEVRHGAYLRGHTFIGDKCVVGHCTEVKHSIFLDGAKAGHFNYIGDSILGNNVNLGAGTKLANLKIISGNIIVKHCDNLYDTQLRKLGSILGDSCETGCNAVLNPGTLLAPKSMVFPNVSARGVYLKRSVIK